MQVYISKFKIYYYFEKSLSEQPQVSTKRGSGKSRIRQNKVLPKIEQI